MVLKENQNEKSKETISFHLPPFHRWDFPPAPIQGGVVHHLSAVKVGVVIASDNNKHLAYVALTYTIVLYLQSILKLWGQSKKKDIW